MRVEHKGRGLHTRLMRTGGLCLAWLMQLLPGPAGATAATVHLDQRDASSTVILHIGDRLRIDLPSAPATGYRWKAKLLDASHLQALGSSVRPESGRLDAAGTQVFAWKAISQGTAEIAIQYRRPDDDKAIPPVKQAAVSVEIVGPALDSPPTAPSSAPAGDLSDPAGTSLGTYTGTLRCDDCTAIAAELTLYSPADNARGGTFIEKRRYLGAPGGDRTIAGTGRWTVLQGTYADPSMTVYVLAAPGGGVENLKLDGTRLVPLDSQMLPIPDEPGADRSLRLSP